ncbi:MAG: GGDEF domain-containing protein [Acidobacteriota bacterium]
MEMLSFKKTVAELEVLEIQRQDFARTLARCVQSAGQYAVELHPDASLVFREHMERLAEQTETLAQPLDLEHFHSSFRGELRDYRDQAQQAIDLLRTEVANAMQSVHDFMTKVTSTGSDHEKVIRTEFRHLEIAAEAGDLATIRTAIQVTAAKALESCEELRRGNQMIVAQLQDEIRHLHREVDQERRAAQTDLVSTSWNRLKLDARIKDLFLLNEPFTVLLVGIADWSALASQNAELIPTALRSMVGRLQSLAGKEGMVGRWSDEIFAVVFNLPLHGVAATPERIVEALSGNYSLQRDGTAHALTVTVRVQAVERPKDVRESGFYLNLGQAAFSVTAD